MNKLVLLTVAVAFSAVSFGTTTVASVQNTPVYYLSLGDSLSVGIQPNQSDLLGQLEMRTRISGSTC